ncbi:OmpA family protein [uncultured Dokdonia sp.]|uniref:OmpA family protein n=1 Tax=uncultured Dokdonia sp. TaxID=575653 RepID=UPI002630A611|nr:OmpA family protein [uncultured Dokdonia sp.]
MSKKTRYLFGILLTIVIGMILMWFFCCKNATDKKEITNDENQNNPKDVVVKTTPTATTNMGFSFKDPDGNFAYSSNDNFNFTVSDFNPLTPISDKINLGIGELQKYLNGNDGKYLDITGHYTSDEKNTSAFPNLGIARANAVKNYLSSKGISSKQINIFGKEDNSLVPDGSIFKGPISYLIHGRAPNTDAASENKELEDLKKRINDDPLILYFENAQASINLTAEQRQKIADISRYLDKIESSSITIEGHTDNSGKRATNIPLGKKRADFVKGFFQRNGIPEAKIITTSKGPDEPIASNATEEGRAKNRRSIVKIN